MVATKEYSYWVPDWQKKVLEDLKRHEGCQLTSYWDDTGKCWTIGYGHTKTAKKGQKITQEQAEELLVSDIEDAIDDAKEVIPSFFSLDQVRKTVLVNMAFNLGRKRLSGFHRMIDAVGIGDYLTASLEMMASRWARQVKGRAKELAQRMRTGEY